MAHKTHKNQSLGNLYQKPDTPYMLEGQQPLTPQARQFLAGKFGQMGQQALQGQQSRQADYQKRMAAWKQQNAERQAKKRKKKEKKVLGLF